MPLTKEERYARHREYQNRPEQKLKRIAYDKARQASPEYRERARKLRRTPEAKERQRIANAKYRAQPGYLAQRRAYKSTQKAKDARRNQLLVKNFGITLDQYNVILEKQGGVCAICLKHSEKGKRSLALDHDHRNGKIRGLLCRFCNQAIGQLDDDVDRLIRAIKYLQCFTPQQPLQKR